MTIIRTESPTRGVRYKARLRDLHGNWMRSHTWDKKIDAEREERELLQSRDKGTYCPERYVPLPFAVAAQQWLDDTERRGLSLSYRSWIIRSVKRYMNPYVGDMDIKKISPSDISKHVKQLVDEGIKPVMINNVLKDMKALLNFHVEEETISCNPVKKKHKVRRLDDNIEQVVWTPEEAAKFLGHADKKYQGERRWPYLIYKIALNTGMRIGEILALEKADFEFENSRVRISKSIDQKLHTAKMPKNGKARYAPLSQELADEVRRYCLDNKVFGSLFVDEKGVYRSYSTFRKCHFFKDIAETGVRMMRFHNCRYFYVREYLTRGGVEAQLRKIVGHASQRMTDRYNTLPKDMVTQAQVVSV